MKLLGLPVVDVAVVVAVLGAIIVAGLWASRSGGGVKRETDFFIGGRKLGGLLQFFLTFGFMADSNEATIIATEVYRQGVGGMWIGFQALFVTPFYWFTPVWFRRTRLITYADLFKDRFDSDSLAMCYSWINILMLTLTLALGNLISFKLAAAMMVKPASEYTAAERESVGRFNEYQQLRGELNAGRLTSAQEERYLVLDSLWARNELPSYISYIKPGTFYVCYSLIVGSYLLLGGIKAVALIDGIQGLLIVVVSVLLIPFGLMHVGGAGGLEGGLSGLHQAVPAFMFRIFGASDISEYNGYSILAIVINCLVGTPSTGGPGNASGKNERAIRVGTLSGAFGKRVIMIAWMFCGLIAVAIFGRGLSDADTTWGMLSAALLVPGCMGLMIAGMLVGHMPNVGYTSINISALFTRNVYEPVVRGRSQRHYMIAAKLSIVVALALAGIVATFCRRTGVIAILTTTMTFIAFFGATGYLIYFWRRLTAGAIWIGMILWIALIGVLPWMLPQFESFRRQPSLLLENTVREVVSQGAPGKSGSSVVALSPAIHRPVPLFFDKIARVNPVDPSSAREGIGRFNMENYLLYRCGLPLESYSPGGVTACRWYFDSVFPFALLMAFSVIRVKRGGREEQEGRNDRFFAKMRTPIGATAEEDQREVSLSYADPHRFDHCKLWPRSEWEMGKWRREDVVGFAGCWGIVVGILIFLEMVLVVR